MNISDISTNRSYDSTTQNPWQQKLKDFKSLSNALQSGDLTSAQSAFATWQKDLPGNQSQSTQSSSPFGTNTQANSDFQSLSTALQSGDVAAAQKAFSSLRQDLRTGQAHHGHHHQVVQNSNDGDSDDTTGGRSATTTVGNSLNVQA